MPNTSIKAIVGGQILALLFALDLWADSCEQTNVLKCVLHFYFFSCVGKKTKFTFLCGRCEGKLKKHELFCLSVYNLVRLSTPCV